VVQSGRPSTLIQVHFIQHSTRLPHPLASTPILDVCTLKGKDGPPKLNAAVSGENLALVISSEYHLGGRSKRMELENRREEGGGAYFCATTRTLFPPHLGNQLDVVLGRKQNRINHLRLIHSLCLPQIKEDEYETIEITSPSQPSFPLTSPQKANLPVTSNPLSSILLIEVIIRTDLFREPWRTFTFIAHRHTLLDLILEAMDSADDSATRRSSPLGQLGEYLSHFSRPFYAGCSNVFAICIE